MRAELASLAGDNQEAIRCTEMAKNSLLDSVSDRRLTATYAMSLGNVPLAVQLLKRLAEEDTGSVLVWSNLGDGYYRLGRYADAITCYSVCAALAPEINRYRFSRGHAYSRLGDPASAQADYTHIIDRDPQNVDALINRSLSRRKLKNYSGALSDLMTAASLPEAPQARIHFQAAEVLRMMGDLAGAEREKALGLKTDCMTEFDWIARGNCELGNKAPEAALECFLEASKLNPESVIPLYNQAMALAGIKGRMEDAIKVLDKTLSLYPEYVDARSLRGLYLARLGKRDLAVKDAEDVLRSDHRATTRYLIADIYALCSRSHPNDAVAAIANLAAAFRGGNGLDDVKIDTDLDPIRSNPEFQKLCSSAQQLRTASRAAGLQ
jgi:tetratricopeptide (TPR) repeat protein